MSPAELCVRYKYKLLSSRCCCIGCKEEPLYFGVEVEVIHLRCKKHLNASDLVCNLVAGLEHLEYYLRLGKLL